jgi:hypothetical protein
MFLVSSLDAKSQLAGKDLAFIPQFRGAELQVEYPWNGVFLADLSSALPLHLMDWHPGFVESIPCDVGGQNFFWMRKHCSQPDANELTAITLYSISETDLGWRAHIAINGNWNINVNYEESKDLYTHDFEGFLNDIPDPQSLSLPRRVYGSDWQVSDLVESIVTLVSLQKKHNFPEPAYFDLIGTHEAGKVTPWIFHYKSGSNYQSWATEKYNSEKTRVLKELVFNGI